MYVLLVALLLSKQVIAYSPNGKPFVFADIATCEAQLEKDRPKLEAIGEPFTAKCVPAADVLGPDT